MSSPQPPYRRGYVAATKRKRAQSLSPEIEGEYEDEWDSIEDDPLAKKHRAEHLEVSIDTMAVDAIAVAEKDHFARYSDRHSEIPPSDEDKAPNQKTPKARKESAIATMFRIWGRTPDTLFANSIHPRFVKQPNFLKDSNGVKLDFKDWPQGVLGGFASLAERSVSLEQAVKYVKRAFKAV